MIGKTKQATGRTFDKTVSIELLRMIMAFSFASQFAVSIRTNLVAEPKNHNADFGIGHARTLCLITPI